jgi:glycosyltransferase involved in cell wall biosynthesis
VIKVAHIVGSLHIGGAERFVVDLCRVQKDLGTKPAIISSGKPNEPLVKECIAKNIPVASYSGSSVWKLIRIFFVLLKFDVIHFHSPFALKFLSKLLPYLNKRIIYTRHGASSLSDVGWQKLHKKTRKYISAITFVSQEGMDNFQQQHAWHDIPSIVIDNGVLISPVNKVKSGGHVLRIGSVGRMIPLKNQIGLLKAINLLNKQSQSLVNVSFFGDGECATALKIFHKENLPELDFSFNGMVSDREFIYSSFDVLVVCSETEGLSMVIIEAMANNIPVIATNVGGNPKLVINDKTGWLFEYDDDKKLANIIQSIIDNQNIIYELGEVAFSYISKNFSIEASAKKYAKLYER